MGGAGEVTGPGPGSPQAGVGKSGGGGGEGHAGRVATERLECGSQARRPAPSAGMGSAARAGAARALEEARRAAKETVFLWAAFWVGHVLLPSAFGNTSGDEGHARLERSSRQRGKRCPSLVARHGAIRRPGGVSSRSCARAPSDRAGKMPNIIRDLRSGPVS
ncbi:unnamed protein product [Prorocentrum cordatum]|uniref:Uncharacterized protein n=1 Tax=Prorocentrum cordatum TaxID=2364126 RepID=A0ABN9QXV4_9DINO|nr:unnamed protein product [Polarella glacialis]